MVGPAIRLSCGTARLLRALLSSFKQPNTDPESGHSTTCRRRSTSCLLPLRDVWRARHRAGSAIVQRSADQKFWFRYGRRWFPGFPEKKAAPSSGHFVRFCIHRCLPRRRDCVLGNRLEKKGRLRPRARTSGSQLDRSQRTLVPLGQLAHEGFLPAGRQSEDFEFTLGPWLTIVERCRGRGGVRSGGSCRRTSGPSER